MAYASISGRKLRAADSNPEAPVRKVQRGSGSSDELVDELVVDSAAPSWGQNIQKMMICMMGKIDGTADDILEVKTLATNAKSEAAEASTAVNLLRVEVDTIKKRINELQGRRRPSRSEQDDEKRRTITLGFKEFVNFCVSMFIFEFLHVQSWSEPPLRRRIVALTQKPKIDTNYRRGTVWYHDVRMGDFKDGLQRWTVGAHEQWRQIWCKIQGALQRALFDQFRGANAASFARA